MPNNYFKFKQFTIHQDKCAMKVGTDGVLLGAWVKCDEAATVLDIGTGTGLIALMIAQRSNALIDAIEIDADACVQAKENIDKSPWKNRINIINQPFQDYANDTDKKYDLIVSNPPYFQNSLNAPDEQRSKARHNKELELIEIISGASKLLSDNGTLSIILPYIEGVLFIANAAENGLYCVRQTNVLPKPKAATKRLLLEFQKTKKTVINQDLVIESGNRHEYSDSYKDLTRDFYLFL
ncbi:MAG: tRNA (adenosine(37)-N6)-methyltransferase TrmM [Bacteroidetes bacterium GWA2_31_9b]|nr:MAG: tRNA (adenosine(37)-N6)-methyltransferase TrmM [Bacteroidetes bacterium GWA2_31_9b]